VNPRKQQFLPVGMGWWVDPRIESVRVAALHAYLSGQGWRPKNQPRPEFLFFEKPSKVAGDVLAIPATDSQGDYIQRVIEAVTALAAHERRYAVEVLDDILAQEVAETASANGPPTRSSGERTAR
jgi:hypothetical protein